MATQDIRSNLIAQLMGAQSVAQDSTSPFGGIIDTAAYDQGVMFFIQVREAGTATSVTLVIESSDDPSFMTGVTLFGPGDENFIGNGLVSVGTTVPITDDANANLFENRMVTAGLIASKRYLRPAITDVNGLSYDLQCFAIQKAEDTPTEPS